MTYSFGDSDMAALRLKIVAEVFAEASRQFLVQVGVSPRLALDLGCGLGYSTHLLAETLRCQRTVGLDGARGEDVSSESSILERTPFRSK